MQENPQKVRQTWTWRACATKGSLRSDRPLSPTASLHNRDTTSLNYAVRHKKHTKIYPS